MLPTLGIQGIWEFFLFFFPLFSSSLSPLAPFSLFSIVFLSLSENYVMPRDRALLVMQGGCSLRAGFSHNVKPEVPKWKSGTQIFIRMEGRSSDSVRIGASYVVVESKLFLNRDHPLISFRRMTAVSHDCFTTNVWRRHLSAHPYPY